MYLRVVTSLYQASGNGIAGAYYNDPVLPVYKQVDLTIDFDWGSGSPDPRINNDNFTVVWSGQVEALYSETYTFTVHTGDGVVLQVNGGSIIDQGGGVGEATYTGTVDLIAGQRYDITLTYLLKPVRQSRNSPGQAHRRASRLSRESIFTQAT